MKKTKLSLILSGVIIVTAIIVASCKKSTTTTPTTTPDTSTTSATDNNTGQQSSQDITNFGSQGIDNGSLSTYRLAQGASVFAGVSGTATVIPAGNKKIEVTFINFVGLDGHTRNGTIEYDWSSSLSTTTYTANFYKDSGLVINVTTPLNNYTVDNNTVTINTKTIKNIGRVYTSGQPQLTWTDVSNITITKPSSGGTIQWNGNWNIALLNTGSYTYTNLDGTSTTHNYPAVFFGYGISNNFIDWTQALVSVNGTFGGTASDGETYTGNISSPLVLNFNCTPMWTKFLYVAGTINFTPTGKTTRSINYGSGVCDLTYVVSIGSFSVTITI
jgi:hypothetical protein